MDNLIITNALVVNADCTQDAHIHLSGGKILDVLPLGSQLPSDIETIDASGFTVLPGGVDPHVHLHLPTPAGYSCDDFLNGSKAALAGGTTAIIDFVTPNRGQSLLEALRLRKQEAVASIIDYSFHMGVTWWDSKLKQEIEHCIINEGITSFKVYLAYKNSIGIGFPDLEKIMQVVGYHGGVVTVHAEEGDEIERLQHWFLSQGKTSPLYHALSRPPEVESIAVERVINLAKKTNCRVYIVHTSTKGSVDLIKEAQSKGVKVFSETCPQYLLLNEDVYNQVFNKAAPYVISPPIRSTEHSEALWKGIQNQTIQTLATDHCPFNLKGQKDKGSNNFTLIPNGAGGIENRIQLMYKYGVASNKISINQLVALVATNPSSIFGLTSKGKIAPGYDADLVIWDFSKTKTISVNNQVSLCDTSIYEGFESQGLPLYIFLKGKLLNNNHLNKHPQESSLIYRSL